MGGRTEYVITIALMIGKSRMKGEKVSDGAYKALVEICIVDIEYLK